MIQRWAVAAAIAAGVLFGCPPALANRALPGSKPHILVILIDDFGWANGGWHRPAGFNETPTPFMRQLIDQGIELDRHYVYKYCSPTRSAVLSGRRPTSVNVANVDPSFSNPADPDGGYAGIALNMTTMAEKLKSAGYHTHAAGKWDVGMATPRHTPKGRGFDSSLIYFHHTEDPWIQMENGCGNPPEAEEAGIEGNPNNTVRDLWAEQPDETFGHPAFDKVSPLRCEAQSPSLPYPANETGCTFDDALLTSFILDRIHDHADQNMSDPMFLYWATRSVHGLQQAPKLWFDRFSFIPDIPRRKYAAMVSYIDDALGNVTQALKDTGLYDNTLIWLMSDNGGAVGPGLGNNYPLKGGKFSNWEGGIRANSFLSGGVVPETLRGTKSEMLTTGWDIYATVCELAGVDKTDGRAAAAGLPAVDSISQVGLLAGNTTAARSTVVIGGTCYECSDEQGTRSNATVHGIISDEREASGKLWKLLIGQLDMDGWTGPLFPNMTGEPVAGNYDCGLPPDGGCLFDLESDPTEHVDVASANPSVRDRLIDMLLSANKTIYSPNRGKSNPLACETATTKYHFESGDFWGPFLDLP